MKVPGSSENGSTDSSRPSFDGSMSRMPSFETTGNADSSAATTIGLLAASVIVMLLGLVVAYKYKR